MKIRFFEDDFMGSIESGIYEIKIKYRDREASLYIGESVYVMVRCSQHLFEFNKNPNYFGLNDSMVLDNEIEFHFTLFKKEECIKKRKELELELIKEKNPILQSGYKDRMKSIDKKIESVEFFLGINNKMEK